MKKLSWFNKMVFCFNVALAISTLLAYLLPFLTPKAFPFLSVLTLFLPFMLVLNVLFLVFWGIQMKRQTLLSLVMLMIGIPFVNKFYKFSTTDKPSSADDIKVMSYNVRLFNKFEWSEKNTVAVEISDFVKEKNPDIVCIQEFSNANEFDYSKYKFNYIVMTGDKIKSGQAILSKYKIIKKGEIVFPNSANNAIFADVLIKKDTVRVYSIHLQSIKISPDVHEISEDINEINQQKSEKMFKRISKAFKQQQLQAQLIADHKKNCKHPVLICGDLNNSAFSYVYRIINQDLNDSFEIAGSGFGKTYDFNYYPARIDYIFASNEFEIKHFQSFPEVEDSDHFPIIARISLKTD